MMVHDGSIMVVNDGWWWSTSDQLMVQVWVGMSDDGWSWLETARIVVNYPGLTEQFDVEVSSIHLYAMLV